MKTSAALFNTLTAVALMAGWLCAGGCDRKVQAPPPKPAAKESWTAEEIARDPQGYLKWSDQRVAEQIADRERKLADLNRRREELEAKRRMLAENLDDVRNIRRRLQEACERADDEDRWPLKFAGHTLTREKAQAILQQTARYIEERQPLNKTYEELFARMDRAAETLRADIRELSRLREKMAIDLETVRLTQDMQKVEDLRRAEAQLASMSKAVAGTMSEIDSIAPPREPPGRVNIDDMLK